jgi:hypothetical protein
LDRCIVVLKGRVWQARLGRVGRREAWPDEARQSRSGNATQIRSERVRARRGEFRQGRRGLERWVQAESGRERRCAAGHSKAGVARMGL